MEFFKQILHESYEEEDEEIKKIILKLWPQFAKKAKVDERIQNLPIKFEDIDTLELNAAATTDMELVDKELKLGITIDPIIFCFKTERLLGVLCHEMAHAEIVYELYDKYIDNEISFEALKEECKQNQKHYEPWKKAATYISERNNLNPDYATITEIDFEDDDLYEDSEPLQEGKDYKYRAKVGKLWLQGCGKEVDLTADQEEATDYESKTEPTQIFNQMKKDKKIKKKEKLEFQKIEESSRLQEADKSRFIKPIWELMSGSEASIMRSIDRNKGASDFPSAEEIIKFCNSGAADKYRIDWNLFANYKKNNNSWLDEAKRLIKCYVDYLIGKEAKKNPKTQFSDEKKFKILGENKDWLFVAPLNWDACVYMDSFQCGGAGARWCIGYERSSEYWDAYTGEDNNAFVLIYNKKVFGSNDEQKYMMQIYPPDMRGDISVRVWEQSDDPDLTADLETATRFFHITEEDIYSWFETARSLIHVEVCEQTFCLSKSQQTKITVKPSSASLELEKENLSTITTFSFARLLQNITFKDRVTELVYNGHNKDPDYNPTFAKAWFTAFRMTAPTQSQRELIRNNHIHNFVFMNMDEVSFGALFPSSSDLPYLHFHNCKKVNISNVYIATPYDLKEYEEDLKNKNFIKILKDNDMNITFTGCEEVNIGGIVVLPKSSLSVMSPEYPYREGFRFYASDEIDDDEGLTIENSVVDIKINMGATLSPWSHEWRNYIDESRKVLLLNKLLKVDHKLKHVRIYNVKLGYTPVWEGNEALKPEDISYIPFLKEEIKLTESKLFEKVLKEYELCPRDAYNKRQREIDRENKNTLAEGDLYDTLATEFMEDEHFRKTPGTVKFGFPYSRGQYFLISYDTDNLHQIHISLYYKNNKGKLERINSKYIYRSNDIIQDIYSSIAEMAED